MLGSGRCWLVEVERAISITESITCGQSEFTASSECMHADNFRIDFYKPKGISDVVITQEDHVVRETDT